MHAYRLTLRAHALEQYRHEQSLWAILAPHCKDTPSEPTIPAILRD